MEMTREELIEVMARAIHRLEYLALARAQNATDRNDAKSASADGRAALAPPADVAGEVEGDIRAVYAAVRAARTACVPTAPESVWQAKDEAEGNWDSLTNYINPNGAVPTLLRLLSAERARRVEVERFSVGVLEQIAEGYATQNDIESWLADARATHKDTQDE